MFDAKNKICLAIVLVITLTSATVAQEPDFDYIHEQVDKEFEQMRSSARRAYLGLMSYPRDVREAMLELATSPELVVKLVILKTQKLSEPIIKPATVFEPYPKELQDAGKLLLFYPDILKVMQEHLTMTGLLGTVYSRDKIKIKQMVNQIARAAGQDHDEAIDIWTERLQENPEAMEQLIAAAKAYKAQAAKVDQASLEINFEASEDGAVEVADLPGSNFVTYVLDNSDQYPYATDEFLDYYGDYYYGGYYPAYASVSYRASPLGAYHAFRHLDDIHDAVGDWVGQRPHILPTELPDNLDQRIGQIKEQGRFDKAFENARQQRPDLDRSQFLRESSDRFPDLAKRVDDRQIRSKDPKSSRRHSYEKSKGRAVDRRAGDIRRRPTKQKSRVSRGQTTRKHQVSRAQRSHRRSWQQPRRQPRRPSSPQRGAGGARGGGRIR